MPARTSERLSADADALAADDADALQGDQAPAASPPAEAPVVVAGCTSLDAPAHA
jgi:hypothetical protein